MQQEDLKNSDASLTAELDLDNWGVKHSQDIKGCDTLIKAVMVGKCLHFHTHDHTLITEVKIFGFLYEINLNLVLRHNTSFQ